MLDVLHFFFEQDSRYSSAEEAEAVSASRTALYKEFYGIDYRYKLKARSANSNNSSSYDDLDEIKPYIPPTEFNPNSPNPFGKILDAPIG